MAAGIPLEKAVELLETYGEMLSSGSSINEMDYMRAAKEIGQFKTANAVSALGILHAVAGKIAKANKFFEESLESTDDAASVAMNYCFMLQTTGQSDLLHEKTFYFAEKFQTKLLTKIAYSTAYRFGDREALERFMDMHIKLLSEDEGRDMAVKHKIELVNELDDAYKTSGCTKEQFYLLAKIVHDISNEFGASNGRFEVSKNSNNCYVVDILNKDPKSIAEMNYALAERICMEDRLDDCELIARFSPVRELHTGVSYDSGF
ncbi:TPA: hypothetical protein PXM11_001877 [Yersinia enterocolitica]|nr:hypothetical protein [Yersinia enterocolitica]HDL6971094.1 hypothetical protein [Yersinia enterocolitica]HDL6977100.1 hypothetical protein [Yersinia enterocolitica]HDL6987268.1 hypothetical protein [Yersinia enterocolitica]HDL6998124.1 hypothetical protein [Yersinia enterocolitica]